MHRVLPWGRAGEARLEKWKARLIIATSMPGPSYSFIDAILLKSSQFFLKLRFS